MNNVDRLVEENLNLVHYCCHKLKVMGLRLRGHVSDRMLRTCKGG